MTYLTRERLLAAGAPAERDEDSRVFGGTLRLREPTRRQWRAAYQAATLPPDADGSPRVDLDRWRAEIVAAGVVDPNDGRAVFATADDVLTTLGYGEWRWDELARLADLILELGQASPAHLQGGDRTHDAG